MTRPSKFLLCWLGYGVLLGLIVLAAIAGESAYPALTIPPANVQTQFVDGAGTTVTVSQASIVATNGNRISISAAVAMSDCPASDVSMTWLRALDILAPWQAVGAVTTQTMSTVLFLFDWSCNAQAYYELKVSE